MSQGTDHFDHGRWKQGPEAWAAPIICKALVKYGIVTLGRPYNLKREQKERERRKTGKSGKGGQARKPGPRKGKNFYK